MPNARRIIFSSYIKPTQSIESEETSIRHTEFQSSPNGSLGGKGIVTIDATQWGDGWTSFDHQDSSWDDMNDNWELQGQTWSGELSITSATDLTDDTTDCGFLYIKNTGTSVNAEVSLNGSGGNYYIIIPPQGSICLRGTTNLECNEVHVRGAGGSSTTTIEYIIAQLTP